MVCRIYKIIGAMDFWNWKSRYVKLTTIKWMDFGSVLWWTSKTFGELVFILIIIMQSSLKWFDSYLMNLWSMDFYLVKNKHIFSKVHFILKKTWFILKFCKYVSFNEFYKNKIFNEKKSLGINALLLPNYKKTFLGSKKKIQNGLSKL